MNEHGKAREPSDPTDRRGRRARSIVEDLLPRLDDRLREVLLAFTVHRYADGAGEARLEPEDAAEALRGQTGRAWEADDVRDAHREIGALVADAAGDDPAMRELVVALLTFRLLRSDGSGT